MDFPLITLVFLVLGPLYTVQGENYKFEPNCVPACTSSSAPLTDKQPCMCRPDAFPAGCQISPCGPGETSNEGYTCQCTEYFQPDECVTLSCDNGTTSYGPSCPPLSYPSSYYQSTSYPTPSYAPTYYPTQSYQSSNYPSSNYPSSNYQSSNYPSSNYPSSNYPSSNYPFPNYQTTNYPTSSYQSPQYGYSQPSYNIYPSYNLCNKYCVCEPYLPADCTADSIAPIVGGPACACNSVSFETGCTIKPCSSADDMYCECTSTFQPSTCFTPRCSPS